MADKKSLFDKYKIIGENGEEKPADQRVPLTIGEKIEVPVEDELPVEEAFTGFPETVKELLEQLPATEEEPTEVKEESVKDFASETKAESLNEPVFDKSESVDEAFLSSLKTQKSEETEEKAEETSDELSAPVLPKKEKKTKVSKPPKEKKVKEPKSPKKKKGEESKGEKDGADYAEPMTMKDHLTFCLAIFAIVLAIVFVCVKYFPSNSETPEPTEAPTEMSDKLSAIQIQREGVLAKLVQSDIDNVFYAFSPTYELQYYQYRDNRMVPVQSTGSVTANVDMGNETLPVTIDYVQAGDRIFGIGLFRADKNPGVYFYKTVVFKLTNLPQGYESSGKALLLATTKPEPITQENNVWPESFTIDLNTGKTSRFLSNINRNIDITTGAYTTSFCVLTDEGYMSSAGKIPFFSAREYDSNSGKKDVFVKSGTNESVFASNVYGDYVLADGNAMIYLKIEGAGFNVVRKENGKETTVFSLYGALNTGYLYDNEYFLDKVNGTLYNVKTGKETALVGYRMINPEMMRVSPDGKYLVLLGTVNSIMDYQVHIFNLETGDYVKYEEKNFSQHSNLVFIDDKTAMYMVVDPNQGYEYVIFDVSKAFAK